MLSRATLLRRTAALTRPPSQRRALTAAKGGPHKRALSKNQLQGDKQAPADAAKAKAAETTSPRWMKEGQAAAKPPSSSSSGPYL